MKLRIARKLGKTSSKRPKLNWSHQQLWNAERRLTRAWVTHRRRWLDDDLWMLSVTRDFYLLNRAQTRRLGDKTLRRMRARLTHPGRTEIVELP